MKYIQSTLALVRRNSRLDPRVRAAKYSSKNLILPSADSKLRSRLPLPSSRSPNTLQLLRWRLCSYSVAYSLSIASGQLSGNGNAGGPDPAPSLTKLSMLTFLALVCYSFHAANTEQRQAEGTREYDELFLRY